MKRYLKQMISCFAAVFILSAFLCAHAADSLLENTSLSGDGIPEAWDVRSYLKEDYSVSAADGEVTLISYDPNDLRLCQTITVKENTAYVFSAEICASNVMGGRGATLSIDNYSIDGCYIYSRNILGSADWTDIDLTFRTGPEQTTVIVALRLGGYSELSTGSVRFRNVHMKEAGEVSGAMSLAGGVSGNSEQQTDDLSEARKIRLRSFLHLFIVMAVVDAVVLIFGFYRNRDRIGSIDISSEKRRKLFVVAVLSGLVLRSLLSSAWGGHDTDMSCWIGWGNYISRFGPSSFYTAPGHEWYDYPPGYMLVLGLISRLMDYLHISAESKSAVFAYMLPAALADAAIASLIMRCARKEGVSESGQLLLGCLVVYNPAVVMLSGVWGQIDSVLTFFLLLSFLELTEGRRVAAGALYGLAIMIKWQALIYGPVLACAYILHIRSKKDLCRTVLAVAAALGVVFMVSLPFKGGQSGFWVIEKFLKSAGGYRYASVEAYNFLALCGGNWADVGKTFIGGVTYGEFGTAAILLAITISLCMQYRCARPFLPDGERKHEDAWMLFLSASFCMYMIFTFGQYMHERYVFPVMILLMVVYIITSESKWLLCSLLLSVTLFLNEASAMYVISSLASAAVRGGREHNTVVKVCSSAETAFFMYFAYCCVQSMRRENGKGEKRHA